jgi:hypothetical protein
MKTFKLHDTNYNNFNKEPITYRQDLKNLPMQLYSVYIRFFTCKREHRKGDANNNHRGKNAVSLHPRLQEGICLPNTKEIKASGNIAYVHDLENQMQIFDKKANN